MARNTSGRSGFTPENLTAGLDLNIDTTETKENSEEKSPIPEVELPDKETINEEDKGTEAVTKKTEEKKTKRTNKSPNQPKAAKTESKKIDTDKSESVQPQVYNETSSLDDLLNTTEYDKKQENIYLPPETREPLQAVGKLIGKKNGGKSTVVHMALLDFFKNNPETVQKALEKYGKN